MPSIVVTPKYNPFTFDELYRPLAETTKMQMALEDQYNAMEMEAAKLDYLKDSDPDAYAVVKNYENTLRGLAGELASNGLTPQSRQGVYDMRKMYSSDINPINKYITWREAQDKARQAIMDKDSTYRWDRSLEDIKYNNWKNNPDMLFKGISGEDLAKMAQTSIKNITNKWREDPVFRKLKDIGLDYYWQKIENYGMNVQDMINLSNAIANRNDLTEEEKKSINNQMTQAALQVRDQVIGSTNLPEWSNYEDLNNPNSELSKWVDSNINRGLWAGIGKEGDNVFVDNLAAAEAKKKQEALDVNELSWGPITKEGVIGTAGVEPLNEFYQEYKEKFDDKGKLKEGVFKGGSMGITHHMFKGLPQEHNEGYRNEHGGHVDNWVFGTKREDGKVELDVNDPVTVVAYYLSKGKEEEALKFIHEGLPKGNTKIVMDDFIPSSNSYKTKDRTMRYEDGKFIDNSKLGITKDSIEKAWKFINEELPESNYDAKASTRYRWDIDSSNAPEFKNKLVRSLFKDIGGEQGEKFDIPIVDYFYKEKGYKDTGETISSEDFMKSTPQSIAFSKDGMIVTMVRENGGSFDVKLPTNLNRDIVNTIQTYFNNSESIAKKRKEYIDKHGLKDKNPDNWTEAEINDMWSYYSRFTNNIRNAHALIANIIGTNKVKPYEYEQSGNSNGYEAFNTNTNFSTVNN